MEIKRGIPVSPGVAIGPAFVYDNRQFPVTRQFISPAAVEAERDRLDQALEAAAEETQHHQTLINEQLGLHYGAIFGAHLQMIRDPKLRDELYALIHEKHYSAEYALTSVLRRYAEVFQKLDNVYMAERATDLFDIERRVLQHLSGHRWEHLGQLDWPVVVLAHNLTPTETTSLNPRFVKGFATEIGGEASHTAIVAGALEIPAVVGLGSLLSEIVSGETVIIDGHHGLVILDPDTQTLNRYQHTEEEFRHLAQSLAVLRDIPATTKDGVRVQLFGNIEFPEEVVHCTERGADGVGLYRTEFLYLGARRAPGEEEQIEAYRMVIEAMAGRPVFIRTLDLGADKFPGTSAVPDVERNPFLGLRSIRFCLQNLPLFQTQLRAILRVSVLGQVAIMFPMVSTLAELRQAKAVVEQVKKELESQAVAFNPETPIGMMVEVPSVALMAEEFAREVDFFSIGTNDLTQYTLAVDRSNPSVADLYSASDPAVLRLIKKSIDAARSEGISVNVCGQITANPIYTALLIGMGLRQLSLTPHAIPEIKKVVMSISTQQTEQIANHVLSLQNAREITSYLKSELRALLPEFIDNDVE